MPCIFAEGFCVGLTAASCPKENLAVNNTHRKRKYFIAWNLALYALLQRLMTIYNIFESIVSECICICKVTVKRTYFVHLQSILKNNLQSVLLIPIAIAFERDVDTLVFPVPAGNGRFLAKLNVSPDLIGRGDRHK